MNMIKSSKLSNAYCISEEETIKALQYEEKLYVLDRMEEARQMVYSVFFA